MNDENKDVERDRSESEEAESGEEEEPASEPTDEDETIEKPERDEEGDEPDYDASSEQEKGDEEDEEKEEEDLSGEDMETDQPELDPEDVDVQELIGDITTGGYIFMASSFLLALFCLFPWFSQTGTGTYGNATATALSFLKGWILLLFGLAGSVLPVIYRVCKQQDLEETEKIKKAPGLMTVVTFIFAIWLIFGTIGATSSEAGKLEVSMHVGAYLALLAILAMGFGVYQMANEEGYLEELMVWKHLMN